MEEYIAQIGLEVNGQTITDFKSFSEDPRVLRKAVKLMSKSGIVAVLPTLGLKLDYVVPKNTPEFNFDNVSGGTITIDHLNGTRIRYTGVSTLEIGEAKYDGENELVKTISFAAQKRA
ncbi:MAG: hypothetical protein EG826_02835 [Deltaproteobacteria bacterium]|nr:hypothetical protein [Deltaproteobacteria bacterium]